MSEDDYVVLYRSAEASGMRKIADLFKVEKPDIAKYIKEIADRTEKGEA